MDIVGRIKQKLTCAFKYGEIDNLHAVIKLIFKDGEMLTADEEKALIELIEKEVNPERVYVCCNRNYKEENLPWSAFLHLHEFKIAGPFTELILKGFDAK